MLNADVWVRQGVGFVLRRSEPLRRDNSGVDQSADTACRATAHLDSLTAPPPDGNSHGRSARWPPLLSRERFSLPGRTPVLLAGRAFVKRR
jgi:hypothetical protein